jgi:4-amino-4-deoxy-L-arabinose transferase-like glycosyltransferase
VSDLTVGRQAYTAPPAPAAEGPAPARQDVLFGGDRGLLVAAAIVWLVMSLWKAALAASVGVVWEEAHFVIAGMHPALAYPDIPAGWPLFARACIVLFGWSPLAIRLPALAVTQTLPLAIYFLSQPVAGRRNALWAALISMLMPPLAASGVIFYSEAAMQILLALMLGGLVRAQRSNRLGWWLLTGLAAGLGLFIHYRFALAGVGVLGFALTTRAGRTLWRQPGLWLAAALAAAGVAPSIAYNVVNHAPAVTYHLASQQGWALSAAGPLTFFAIQLAACTPAFFFGMVGGGLAAWRRARGGERESALLLWVGVPLFWVYAGLSPFDKTIAPQWPIEAYIAFIPYLPGALAGYVDGARTLVRRRLREALVGTSPLIAFAAFIAASLWALVGWAHPELVPLPIREQITAEHEPYAQFEPAIALAEAVALARFGQPALLATSGHVEAVKLEFPGEPGREVYALDDPREVKAHFDVFRAAIGLDRAALIARHAGQPVVVVLPRPPYLYDDPAETAFRVQLCQRFSLIEPVEAVEAPPGRLVMETFTARIGGAGWKAPSPCPLLPAVYIGWPKRDAIIGHPGSNPYSGIAANPSGVARVDILLDGQVAGEGELGQVWPAGPSGAALAFDPDYPRLRFTFALPRTLTPGAHRLAVRMTARDGAVTTSEARTIYAAR